MRRIPTDRKQYIDTHSFLPFSFLPFGFIIKRQKKEQVGGGEWLSLKKVKKKKKNNKRTKRKNSFGRNEENLFRVFGGSGRVLWLFAPDFLLIGWQQSQH